MKFGATSKEDLVHIHTVWDVSAQTSANMWRADAMLASLFGSNLRSDFFVLHLVGRGVSSGHTGELTGHFKNSMSKTSKKGWN